MTSIDQRTELQSKIWKIANDVRGAVDGWDFKQFVLGTLFYRFISENFTNYIEGGDDSIHYIVTLINYRTAIVSHGQYQTERAARRHIGYLLGFAVDYIEGGLK